MQPCEAREPIDQSSAVPWMPTPSVMPSQRAFSGLLGAPPGITWPARDPAHAALGTCHAGLTCLEVIENSPAGVDRPAIPTAIPYVLEWRRGLNRRSLKGSRSMVSTVA